MCKWYDFVFEPLELMNAMVEHWDDVKDVVRSGFENSEVTALDIVYQRFKKGIERRFRVSIQAGYFRQC